jgi:hypothetical protein
LRNPSSGDTRSENRVGQHLKAAGRRPRESHQHRLATSGAEQPDPGFADDRALEAIGQDQTLVRRQQIAREIAVDREIEAVEPVFSRIS